MLRATNSTILIVCMYVTQSFQLCRNNQRRTLYMTVSCTGSREELSYLTQTQTIPTEIDSAPLSPKMLPRQKHALQSISSCDYDETRAACDSPRLGTAEGPKPVVHRELIHRFVRFVRFLRGFVVRDVNDHSRGVFCPKERAPVSPADGRLSDCTFDRLPGIIYSSCTGI